MKVVNFKTGALICMTALPLVLTAPAQAQTASGGKAPREAENVSETDIVVTAQKRDQLLLDVPVSVSAVSSEALVKQNLIRLEDFATRVPGLSVASDRAYAIAIRGINAGGATSPTVATTIDDVPFGTTSWAGSSRIPNLDPSDLQQIEVLRGPQGTLYGASSLGGLIKYVTRPPDPNNFSARAQADVSKPDGGSWGYGLRGAVNVPVIKPLDAETIIPIVQQSRIVVTAENHTIVGGLGSAVAEAMAEEGVPVSLHRVGIRDVFAESGSREYLFEKYGLSTQSILNAVWAGLHLNTPVPVAPVYETTPGEYAPV